MVKTSPSKAGDSSSIPGQRVKIPTCCNAVQPKKKKKRAQALEADLVQNLDLSLTSCMTQGNFPEPTDPHL